jgi:deoxycytidylate deaminase
MEIRDSAEIRGYLNEAVKYARLSTCHRSKCGCVIVSTEGSVIGVGYNSQPCDQAGVCFKDDLDPAFKSDKTCCIHAEQRAIIDALRKEPTKVPGATLIFIRLDEHDQPKMSGEPYCTICSKMALDVGIKWFVLWHREGITFYGTAEYNKLSFKI